MLRTRRCPTVFKVILFFTAGLIPEPSQAERLGLENGDRSDSVRVAQIERDKSSGHFQYTRENARGIASVPALISVADSHVSQPAPQKQRPQADSHPSPVPSASGEINKSDSFPKPKLSPIKKEIPRGTLKGSVLKLKGDFMPTRGNPTSGTTENLSTRIFIYEGKLKGIGKDAISPIPPKDITPGKKEGYTLVAVVKSDKSGKFELDLPTGVYTVLAEINGRLFKNEYDGQGNYATVEIKKGEATQEIIKDNTDASF